LAGINRTDDIKNFENVNVGLTEKILDYLEEINKNIPILYSSSIQAELDNPYGKSKKRAEDLIIEYSKKNNVNAYIYRLNNVFGKWCKANYNSVIATFCHNISRNIEINIHDKNKELELVYIDDVINEFVSLINHNKYYTDKCYYNIDKKYRITLGELVDKLLFFKNIRNTHILPDFSCELTKYLYSTYLSYLPKVDFSYSLDLKEDNRGSLFEFIKFNQFGQIIVSKSKEKVIRGNHYHNTKVEKFCVIKGTALVKFRNINNDEIIEYFISDKKIEVIDIPPGYTHSIENLGNDEMILLIWVNEMFIKNK